MSDTLYEKSNTGDNSGATIYGANWEAQTFTPTIKHTITSVKLLLYRDDGELPGTVTASIRATASSLPTGADLISGTFNGNTAETSGVGAWNEFTFTASTVELSAGTKYAIVFRAPSGDVSNRLRSRVTNPGIYTSGDAVYSTNSGSTWTDYTGGQDFDHQFEEYGITQSEGRGLIGIIGETLHYVGWSGAEYVIQGTAV